MSCNSMKKIYDIIDRENISYTKFYEKVGSNNKEITKNYHEHLKGLNKTSKQNQKIQNELFA